ncbi:6-hydroxymethylpterin diphosphokinase MptE-like protein [Luminiphilus sp. nBUS_07]|uniref:6-hydroxymethylpterin diphosphokinase MptE-like protein n=1 Tax=Luminiphilus sp. nBUS_07 TaxID=3395314 RepID=UPI003EBDE0EB
MLDLGWGLSWRGISARRQLSRLKDKYRDESCVILCNGPSLNEVDFYSLDRVKTIGLNKINLLFERSSFRPTFIAVVNPYVIKQNMQFYINTEIPVFAEKHASRYGFGNGPSQYIFNGTGAGFSFDIAESIPQGHTVTYVALQIAFYLGFTKVALVGCDHNFATKGPPNEAVAAVGDDPNHFDPKYFSDGDIWQLPDLFESEMAYRRARHVYETHGRLIVNCTEGGDLDIFDRVSLADFLADARSSA